MSNGADRPILLWVFCCLIGVAGAVRGGLRYSDGAGVLDLLTAIAGAVLAGASLYKLTRKR